MHKQATSLGTRTAEEDSRELVLKAPETPPQPLPLPRSRASDRIKAALLRWLEQEMG
jgi:hypothetical protein